MYESFRYDLLDAQDRITGRLDVLSGTLDFSINTQPKGSGTLSTVKTRDIDWLQTRLRIYYNDAALITAIPSIPAENYSSTGVAFQIDLYDKTSLLISDNYGATYTVAAGTNIIEHVIQVIESTGETKINITPSSLTLANSIIFEPNTTKLKIVNDLLESAGYWSLSADGMGYLVSSPYVADRPVVHEFVDNETGLYLPVFTRNYDPYNVPNKIICIGKTDGASEALVKTAQDTTYPLGYPYRPWNTVTHTDIEYATADNLQAIADRKLIEAQQVLETFEISHPYLGFGLNDVVSFTNKRLGTRRAVVQKQTYSLSVGGLIKSTIRVVK